jgi:hypothetical protein
MGPARTQEMRLALALGRMVTGALSMIASSILIYKVLLRYRVQQRSSSMIANTSVTTYHRILLGMSIVDVLYSIGAAVGPLAVPAGDSDGMVFGIHGTTATCTAQGAACQLLGAVVLYTAALNTYFMLKIRYNVSDAALSRRYEPWLHAIPLIFAVTTTSIGIGLQIFNPMADSEFGCYIAAYPSDCPVKPETCTRGKLLHASPRVWSWYVWSSFDFWLFLAFAIVFINSLLIYTAIRRQERRNERYCQVVATATLKKPDRCQPIESPHAVATSIPQEDETEGNSCISHDDRHPDSDSARSNDDGVEPIDEANNNETSCGTPSPAFDAEATMPSNKSNIGITRKSSNVVRKAKASRLAALQSTLYCCATFVPALVLVVPWLAFHMGLSSAYLVFLFMFQYLMATQGIFNLLIYIRLPYNRLRKTTSEWSRSKCLWTCLFSSDPKYW